MTGQELYLKIPAADMKARAQRVLAEIVSGFVAPRKPIPIRYILQAAKVDPTNARKAFQLISRGGFYFSQDGTQLINSGAVQDPAQDPFNALSVVFNAELGEQTLRLAVTLPPEIRVNILGTPQNPTGIAFVKPLQLLLYDLPPQVTISRSQYFASVMIDDTSITYTLQDSLDLSSANLFHLVLELNQTPSLLRRTLLGLAPKALLLGLLTVGGCVNRGDASTTPPAPEAPYENTQCWDQPVPAGKVIISESYAPNFPNCTERPVGVSNVFTVVNVEADNFPQKEEKVCVDTPTLPPQGWHIDPTSYAYSATQCDGGDPTQIPPLNNTVNIDKDTTSARFARRKP